MSSYCSAHPSFMDCHNVILALQRLPWSFWKQIGSSPFWSRGHKGEFVNYQVDSL